MGRITKPLDWGLEGQAITPVGKYRLVSPSSTGRYWAMLDHTIILISNTAQEASDAANAHYEALVLDILDNTTVVADLLNRAADAQDASRLALDNMRGAIRRERNATIEACIDVVRPFPWIGGKEVDELCDTLQALKAPL